MATLDFVGFLLTCPYYTAFTDEYSAVLRKIRNLSGVCRSHILIQFFLRHICQFIIGIGIVILLRQDLEYISSCLLCYYIRHNGCISFVDHAYVILFACPGKINHQSIR